MATAVGSRPTSIGSYAYASGRSMTAFSSWWYRAEEIPKRCRMARALGSARGLCAHANSSRARSSRDRGTARLKPAPHARLARRRLRASRSARPSCGTRIGCPYEAALALADANEEEPLRQALDELRRRTELLEGAGLIRKDGERYELTPRGIRKIGQKSLEEIFATLKKDAFGGHRSKSRGRGGDPTDELKTYEFGDPFLLDLPGTVRNAVIRQGAKVPVKLAADDFDVYRTELVTQSATAILVDVSRSMLFRGCFLAAKKVTLALDSLIRSTFPKDDLYIVGFSAYATQLKPTDLPRLTWNEYVYGTNMQHAFETARTLLSRSRGKNKQIILITDGEPTAYFEPGSTYPQFNYPPTKRTFEATLREVVRCTRESITINTFMLARGHYLVDFVNQMSKINNGRAFYVEPEHLGEYVLVDYVSHKRRRVA